MNVVKMVKDFVAALKRQYAAGGITGAGRLILAILMKIFKGIYTKVGSGKRYCPCCGWKGANFLPYIDEGYVDFQGECPVCRSHARHRGHILFYQRNFPSLSGELLYVAPEKNVEYFRKMPGLKVRTSEYLGTASADFHYDLVDIDCPDSVWDVIICHRVIEHVPNDREAMRELYRILKPGGTAVLSVPIDISLSTTVEFEEPNPFESCHFYRYGTDFISRIPQEFAIEAHDFRTLFSPEEFDSLKLYDDFIYLCRKPLL